MALVAPFTPLFSLAHWTHVPGQLGTIFYFIVLPMLLLIGIGFFLQRTVVLDMRTLVRLNLYFIVPGIIYVSVTSSPLTAGDVGIVVAFHLVTMVVLAGVTLLAARLR